MRIAKKLIFNSIQLTPSYSSLFDILLIYFRARIDLNCLQKSRLAKNQREIEIFISIILLIKHWDKLKNFSPIPHSSREEPSRNNSWLEPSGRKEPPN